MPAELGIVVMPVDGLDETAIRPWRASLDAAEREKASRFVFARNRIEYTAAHVLLRHALAAASGHPPAVFRFEAGAHGKPTAWIGPERAGIHFNLSHTKGLVAVAVGLCEHGLDVEPIRDAVNLAVARHAFARQEIAWLEGLGAGRQAEGFLRLWTLKEAFIKATGLGLSQPLDTFWFDVCPSAIRFADGMAPAIRFADGMAEDPDAWIFEQRVIAGQFLAAVGLRRPPGPAPRIAWWRIEAAAFSDAIERNEPLPLRPVAG
jgi:4'-phosphopantetheinyl transferase